MITILMILFLILLVATIILFCVHVQRRSRRGWDPSSNALAAFCPCVIIFALAFIGLFIAEMVLISDIGTASVYDSKIEIVEQENTELETQICSAVENYLQHEENVFAELDITTAIGLYSAYPNLKGNELVKQLIDTYRANTNEIKQLKLQQADISKYKWLIYFGH